jgi:hypothetical protein
MISDKKIRITWIALLAVGLACSFGAAGSAATSGGASGTPESNASSGGSATVAAYQTPDPITVQPTLDDAKAASDSISAVAGVARDTNIFAKLPAGGDFNLVIPGALLARDTDGSQIPAFGTPITVTPISAIAGIPFQKGYLVAFHIGPEGILLAVPGSLSITLPGEITSGDLVGFAADGGGTNFHLYPIQYYTVSGSTKVTIGLSHYSLYGVAQATQAEIEAQQAHPPQDAGDQDDDLLAAPLSKIQQNLAKVHDRGVKPLIDRLDNLAGNCNDVTEAAFKFERWYTQVTNASATQALQDRISRDANVLSSRLLDCLKKACPLCLESKKADKKSANTFIVLATWMQSVDQILDRMPDYNMWSQLINKCAANAGLPLPQPAVAACEGPNCGGPSPTPLTCP